MKNLKKILQFIIVALTFGSVIESVSYHTAAQNAAKLAHIGRQRALVDSSSVRAKAAWYTCSLFSALVDQSPENQWYKKNYELAQINVKAHEQSVFAAQKTLDRCIESHKKSEDSYKKTREAHADNIKFALCKALLVPIVLYEGYKIYCEESSKKSYELQ